MLRTFLFTSTMIVVTAGCSSTSTVAQNDAGGATEAAANDGTAADAGNGCTAYCTSIMGACTGANQQFTGMDQCVNSCKAFPVGTAADTAGHTLGCRTYHAGAA